MLPFLAFYFTYFSLVGIFMPYVNLFLAERGMNGAQIGAVSALVPLLRSLAQPFAGALSDKPRWRRPLLLVCGAGAVVGATALWPAAGFMAIVGALLLYAIAQAPILPAAEVVVLEEAERRNWQYGQLRLWGSVGFIVASTAFGAAADRLGLGIFAPALAAISLANLISLLPLSRRTAHDEPESGPDDGGPLPRGLWMLLAAAFFMQLSHGPYYAFYSLHLAHHGWSKQAIGGLWALGVAAEVALMARSGAVLGRLGWRTFFRLAFVLAVVRWGILAATVTLPGLVVAQLLHAGSFGALHLGAMHWLHTELPRRRRGLAQSLYSAVSFGIAGAISMFAAGLFFDRHGAKPLFAAAAVAALIGLGLASYVTTGAARSPAPRPLD